jgi:hypothetical protein
MFLRARIRTRIETRTYVYKHPEIFSITNYHFVDEYNYVHL